MKLNLGGGKDKKIPGWINLDVGIQNEGDFRKYNYYDLSKRLLRDFEENSVEVILCNNVFEHLSYETCYQIIKESYRILKPDGILRVIVPNLEGALKSYQKRDPKYCLLFKKADRWKRFGWQTAFKYSFLMRYLDKKEVAKTEAKVTEEDGIRFGHVTPWDESLLKLYFIAAGFQNPVRTINNRLDKKLLKNICSEMLENKISKGIGYNVRVFFDAILAKVIGRKRRILSPDIISCIEFYYRGLEYCQWLGKTYPRNCQNIFNLKWKRVFYEDLAIGAVKEK